MQIKVENFIRRQIQMLISEQEEEIPLPRGPGRGRYKKGFSPYREAESIAYSEPDVLMSRLNISKSDGKISDQLMSAINSAINSSEEMRDAYTNASAKTDKFGRKGILVGIGSLSESERDALMFMRLTVDGMKNAGVVDKNSNIQVELLANRVVIYSDKNKLSWNSPPKKTKKVKKEKPEQENQNK